MDSLQSHESGVYASIETSLLKLNIVDLIDLLYLYQITGASVLYGRTHKCMLKNTRQTNKFHSFINERNFDKVAFMINFGIDVRTESMLSITPS